jgi:hypothetical protein
LDKDERMKVTTDTGPARTIYWHRELPPLTADVMGEHTIEASSARVPGTLAHRDELWEASYRGLMDQTRIRLEQEVARLGGHYAHVLGEVVDARHDEAKGEAWLQGRFTYMLYRRAR